MTIPGYSGCQAMQCTVGTAFVEPGSEVVQLMLDRALGQVCQHQLPPETKGPQYPLDLTVPQSEKGRDDTRSHRSSQERHKAFWLNTCEMSSQGVHDPLGHYRIYQMGSLNNLTFYSSFVFLLRCGSNKVFDAPSMVFFHPAKTLFLTFAGFYPLITGICC